MGYYENVIEDLKITGRFQYFPQCEYSGDGKFKSLLDETLVYQVRVLKKTVDATLTLTNIPATKIPEYGVAEGVNLVPINGIANITSDNSRFKWYVVIGAGKTGLDALLYLLDNGVDPDKIVWIVSNDCWYINRDKFLDLNCLHSTFPEFYETVVQSKDVNEVYERAEKINYFIRVDKKIWPKRMRAATVSSKELTKIQAIKNIVRNGRISRIEKSEIIFERGDSISTSVETLHIDCSTAGTKFSLLKEKVFSGNKINLMMTLVTQQCTSAAVIAALEVKYPDNEVKKNECCIPFNAPQLPAQWFELNYLTNTNIDKIASALGYGWLRKHRLSPLYHMSFIGFVKMMLYILRNKEKVNEKLKSFGEQQKQYGVFKDQV